MTLNSCHRGFVTWFRYIWYKSAIYSLKGLTRDQFGNRNKNTYNAIKRQVRDQSVNNYNALTAWTMGSRLAE